MADLVGLAGHFFPFADEGLVNGILFRILYPSKPYTLFTG